MRFLGERCTIDELSDTQLPQLSTSILQVLSVCPCNLYNMTWYNVTLFQHFLDLEEDDATVKGVLKLLKEFTSSKETNSFILEHKVGLAIILL